MDASGVRFPGHYLICRLLGIGSGLLAKKTHENDLVQTAVSTAARYIFDNVFGKINEELRLILGNIEKKGYQIQERMLERLFSFLTLGLHLHHSGHRYIPSGLFEAHQFRGVSSLGRRSFGGLLPDEQKTKIRKRNLRG